MKKSLFTIFVFSIILMLTMCTKENGDQGETSNLTFEKALPGGCNGQDFEAMKNALDEQDTLIFTLRDDTLDAFIGVNYICCAPFKAESRISNDSIFMTISDTCPSPYACYCRCMCYYSWNFLFTGMAEKDYYYKVTLNDPRQDEPQTLWEGILQ